MNANQTVRFGPFRLDATNAHLWCGSDKIPLKPKTFSVLCYLVERAGQLVTKDELLKALWPNVRVGDAVLKVCIREIRQALEDQAKAPQFIETVHRRGYRFIGEVVSIQHSVVSREQETRDWRLEAGSLSSPQASSLKPQASNIVGREVELAQLHQWLVKAQNGERQIIFVTGEAGIGKTTVVEAFLDPLEGQANVRVSRAHCLEQYGEGEPYMPVLEALSQLCHEPGYERILETLSRYAPTWLVQMPSLLTTEALEALQPRVLGTTKERMLRELAEALEALTAEHTLVLQFDDLHWSDSATLDLISYVARRPHPAQLLIIGTYRLDDVERREHPLKPLKQDLHVHRYCEEITLAPLSETAVATYLTRRLTAPSASPQPGFQQLTQMIHQRTEGNPLFMVSLVDYVTSQEVPVDEDGGQNFQRTMERLEIPLSLRAFLEHQISQVSEKAQQALQAASIAGREFSAAAVAAGREESIDTVELVCEELAHQSLFLQRRGTDEWPDGTVAARYRFLHVLHQNVLAESMTTRQRIIQHRRVGERLEAAYGTRVQEIAAELALRFEEGRDYNRALQYRWQAGTNATRRHAHQEAIIHFTKALDLLALLPDTQERKHLELGVRIVLGGSLVTAKGHAAPEVEAVYAEAQTLCQEVGDTPQLFPALAGLYRHYVVRGTYNIGRTLGNQLLHLAQHAQESTLLMGAHGMLGYVLFLLGDFSVAQEHLEQSISLYDVQRHRSIASLYGDDPGVASLAFAAWTLWLRGYPNQALQRNNAALLLAHEVAHPHVHATALGLSAQLHRFRREEQTVQERSADVLALATEYGFPLWTGAGTVSRGWALAEQGMIEEGISQIHQGLLALHGIGSESQRPHYLGLLAEIYGKAGQPQTGLRLIEEALSTIDKTGERFWEAELYRLRGELTLAQSSVQSLESGVQKNQKLENTDPRSLTPDLQGEVEACFLKAIEIARQQEAKSLELRATMSLARLWQQQDKQHEACNRLSSIYNWFTEGFDTADLQEAKALLDTLT